MVVTIFEMVVTISSFMVMVMVMVMAMMMMVLVVVDRSAGDQTSTFLSTTFSTTCKLFLSRDLSAMFY